MDVFLYGIQLTVTDNSGQAVTINTTNSSFGIGTSPRAANQGFIGFLGELSIYDSALTGSEIANLALEGTIHPTIAGSDIVDDQSSGPVDVGTRVTYTLTFSEDIDDSQWDGCPNN